VRFDDQLGSRAMVFIMRTELVHARDDRELHFAEDWVTKDIREYMLDLCQALGLLVVLVAPRGRGKRRQTYLRGDSVCICEARLATDGVAELFLDRWLVQDFSGALIQTRLPDEGNPSCDTVSNLEDCKWVRDHIPLQVVLVVDEDLVGLWYNPDL
jgi:hypothetical protein